MRRSTVSFGLLGLLLWVSSVFAQKPTAATSVDPASVPAGTGALSVTMAGNYPLATRNAYSFCVFSGGVASKIAPTSISTTSAVLPLPATAVQVAPGFFASGTALVKITIATRATVCADPGANYNVALQVLYPTITSLSFLALQQNNLTPGPASVPNKIEVFGANYLTTSRATVAIDQAYSSNEGVTTYITSGSLVVNRPVFNDLGLKSLSISICNTGGNNTYCSGTTNAVIPLYAPSPTNVGLDAAPPGITPGGSTTLTAVVSGTASSQTAGGAYIPGAPSGSVRFTDTTTGATLGTSTVQPNALTLVGVGGGKSLTLASGGFHPGATATMTPIVADFNQDGVPDTLIIQNSEADAQLFLGGSPAGNIQASKEITATQNCYSLPSIAAADINGDGYPDLVYLCGDSGGGSQVYILLNQGDGTFPDFGTYVADAGTATQLVLGDFNNDGIIDIVATGQTNHYYESPAVYGIESFFGDGNAAQPGFTAGPVTATADPFGTQLIAADLNADKLLDIVLLHNDPTTGIVSIQPYKGDGKGNFTAAESIPVPTGSIGLTARQFTAATTFPDLAVVVPGTGVSVFLNKRSAAITFGTAVQTALSKVNQALFADFDGDGLADVVWYDTATVRVLSGNGGGGFRTKFGQSIAQANLILEAAPDLNADGYADLVLYSHNGPNSELVFHNIITAITNGSAAATLSATFAASGTHNITAAYLGNIDLASGSGTTTVTVSQLTPVITWNPPTTATTTTPINGTYLNATASVPGTFAYTPVTGSYLASGVQTITAVFTPTDTTTYATVTTNKTVTVSKSDVPTFVFNATPAGQTYNSGTQTVLTITLNGTHFAPGGTVQFFDGATSLGTANLSAVGSNSNASLTLASIATGSHTFSATYNGNAVYNQLAIPTARYIAYTVSKASPIIAWTPNPQTIAYGTTLSSAQLNATAKTASGTTIPGTFVYNPAAGTLLNAGTQALAVTFTPTDTTNYNTATGNTSVTVTKLTPELAWTPNPQTIPYGFALSATQLNATARNAAGTPIPGAFVYNPAFGTVLNVGEHSISVTFTPTDTTDYTVATDNSSVIVERFTPTLIWTTPAPITFGTPLSSSQLNAAAKDINGVTVLGTYVYTPAAGAIPPAGVDTLSVTFTPNDLQDYNTSTNTVPLTVNDASTTTTLAIKAGTSPVSTAPAGTIISLVATVLSGSNPFTPGEINFCDATAAHCTGGNLLGTAQLTRAGTATLRFTPAVGTHSYKAVLLPTTNSLGSSSAASPLAITGTVATTTALSATGAPGNYTLTAVTTGTGNPGSFPTGAISFSDTANPGVSLGSANLVPGTTTETLVPKTSIATGDSPVATGDFNNDGKQDVLAVAENTLSIYLGDGHGGLTLTKTVTGTIPGFQSPIGDFNNDGIPDIFYLDGNGNLSVLLGVGDGTFTSGATLPGTAPALNQSFVLGDFNRDGNLDVAFVGHNDPDGPGIVNIYAGAGDGTFTLLSSSNPGTITGIAAAGDFNGDGILDLLIDDPTAGFVHILRGKGDGTFTAQPSTQLSSTFLATVIVSDLNGDGIADLTSQDSNGSLTTFIGKGDGTFTQKGSVPFNSSNALALADLNGDGIPDFIANDETRTYTYLGVGDGTFKQSGTGLAGNVGLLSLADFNGDGLPDLVGFSYDAATGITTLITDLNTPISTASAKTTAINPAGGGQHSIVANYPGDMHFKASTSSAVALTGQTFAPSVLWTPNPATIPYGTALSAAQLNATAVIAGTTTPIPGIFTYTPAAGTVLAAGTQTLSVLFTPTDNVTYTAVSKQATITVSRAAPAITWATPASITQGTALSATQLNATAKGVAGVTLPGAFVYTPAAGTVLQPGTRTLNVTFTPTDIANYTAGTASTTLQITNALTRTVLTSSNLQAPFGQAITLTATVAQTGTEVATLTGNVVFTDVTKGVQLGTVALSAGKAILPVSNLSGGLHVIQAVYSGDANYVGSTSTAIQQGVSVVPSIVTWTPAPATIAYGTALGAGQLDAVAKDASGNTIPGSFAYTPAAGTILNVGSQTLSVTFTPTQLNNYAQATQTAVINITRGTPSISWPAPAPITQGTPLSATQLNAAATYFSAAVPGTYTYTPAAGTIPAAGVQTISLLFTPTDLTNFTTATATNSISVTKLATTTAVASSANPGTAGQSVTLTANVTRIGSSTTPLTGSVTFAEASAPLGTVPVTAGVASLPVASLTVGSHLITATYSGDTNDLTSQGQITQVVNATGSVLTWSPTTTTIPYGTALGAAELDAVARTATGTVIPGTFTYTPAAGTVLNAGSRTLNVAFTPTDTTNFKAATAQTIITITQATPTIAWPPINVVTAGTTLSGTQLNATARGIGGTVLPGAFVYTPAAGTVLQVGTQALALVFTPADTVNYLTATATNSVTVSKSSTSTSLTSSQNPSTFGQSITITAIITRAGPGTALLSGSVTFVDGSTNIGTTQVSSGAAVITLPALTAGSHLITAIYSGDANDLGSQGQMTQVVGATGTVLTWSPTATTIPYGTALGAAQLNAVAKTATGTTIPGTFIYTPATGTILNAGSQTLNVTFTPTDTTTFKPATAQTVITVTKATPSLSWPAPAPITLGTALSATQLDAAASYLSTSVPGTYTYTPAAGTILTAGVQALSLLFTPNDLVNFNTATANNSISVAKLSTTTAITSSANPGEALQPLGLTATVTRIGSSTSPITGSITFTDGSNPLGTVPVSGGIASLPLPNLAVGSHLITATYSGDTNDLSSQGQITQVVNPIVSVVTFIPFVNNIFFGTPLGPDQLNAVARSPRGTTIPGTFTYNPAAGTVLAVGPHTISAFFTPTDSANFKTATQTAVVTVTQSTTVVTWAAPAAITYGTALSTTQLNAVARDSSGNTIPGTYVYTPAAGTVLNAGSSPLSVAFTPTNRDAYSAATGSTTLIVNKADTTTVFSVTPLHILSGQTTTLRTTVTTASGAVVPGPVTFFDGTSSQGQVVPNGGFASITHSFAAGTHPLTASFSGNTNYNASVSPIVSLVVDIGATILTWTPTTSTISYGTALTAAQLNAVAKDSSGATIPGNFTYTPRLGTILTAGSQTLNVTFTPTDATNFQTATAQTVITVTKATPLLSWPTPAAITQGTALSSTQLNATATFNSVAVPGTFTYTPAAGTIPAAGTQALAVLFTPSDTTDFNTATATNSISVTKAATTTTLVSSANPANFGQSVTLTATVTRADSAIPTGTVIFFLDPRNRVTIPIAGGVATYVIGNPGVGTYPISVSYQGDNNNNGSSAQITQVVSTGIATVTWAPTVSTLGYGTALSASQLNAVANTPAGVNLPGSFTYTPALGTILDAGSQTLNVSFVPTDKSYQTITGTTIINVTKATPTLTWPAITHIDQGTPLSATQLNATVKGVDGLNLPGNFTYTPAAGTILQPGLQTLTVSFAPTNATDYITTTATNTLQVNNAPTITTIASSQNPTTYGQSTTFTAVVVQKGTETAPLTGTVNFFDIARDVQLASVPLTSGSATLTISTLPGGSQAIMANYTGDANYQGSSAGLSQLVNPAAPVITWTPDPANIPSGTALSGAQLDAVAKDSAGNTIPGAFAYTPAAGTVLAAGPQTLTAIFTPTDAKSFTTATATASITVQSGATSTTLAITSGGAPVTSVTSGTIVTLTATALAGASPITSGQVNFCDAAVTYCTDIHLYGTAQLGKNGTASIKFAAGIGDHSYKAVLLPTTNFVSSASDALPLTVTGKYDTSTVIAQSGTVGNYTLTATTTGFASPAASPTGTVSFLDTSNGNAALGTAVLGAGTRAVTFNSSSSDLTGTGYYSTATGDFNGDGKPDLAITNRNANTITVLLGNGDGTFRLGSTTPTGGMPLFVATGDFNGDGILDIATPNFNDNTVTVLLGNGDGTFTAAPSPSSGASINPVGIAIADFNADGIADLAVTTEGNKTVTILLGKGDGTFTASPSTPSIGDAAFTAVSGDFNNDGRSDLAVSNFNSHSITILLGKGDGTFTTGTPIDTGFEPRGITLGDFNGDGKIDLAIPNYGDSNVNIMLGKGDGTFASVARIQTTAPYAVATGDFNRDGKLDLAVTNFNSSTATILLGNGDGTFTAITPTATGGSPSFLSVGDFNGDGGSDIAIANQGTGSALTILKTQLLQTTTATSTGISPIGGTQHQVIASYPGDTDFNASTSAPTTLTGLAIVTPTISWTPAVASIPSGTPLGTQQLNATASVAGVNVPGTFTYAPAAATILNAGIHTLSVSFAPADSIHFLPATATTSITVVRTTPTLTWPTPAAINQGTALSATQLDASTPLVNGVPVPAGTYSYTPAAGTILQAGTTTLSVLFTPTDTTNYTTATASVPLTVNIPGTKLTLSATPNPSQSGQTVTLTAVISQTGTGLQPITGAVTFYNGTKAIGTAPLAGNTATFPIATLAVGSHSFNAIYGGSTNYATSTSNTLAQSVGAATTTIHWTPNPASIVYGTALSDAQLDAIASSANTTNIPGKFVYTPAAGSLLTTGTQTLSVAFTPTDAVSFAPATGTATITVTRATPALAWAPPAAIKQGTPLSASQLNATATGVTATTLPGTFTYTPAAGTVLPAGTTTLSVLFTPTDTVNYTTRTLTVPLTVEIPNATTTLTSSINPSQYGQSTTLTATVTQGGTGTTLPTGNVNFFDGTKLLGTSPLNAQGIAAIAVNTLTSGAHTLSAAYAGDASAAGSTSQPLTETVSKASSVITFVPTPASIVYGTPLTAAQLDATVTSAYIASVPGTFAYTPALNAVLPAGTAALSATFTPTDSANFAPATKTAALTITKATPAVTFPTPPFTVVGSTLSPTQLNASATGVTGAPLPGSFTYTPAAGTIVTAGPQVLTVLFTPADSANYTTATATTTLNGTALTLTALDSTKASLGDKAKTITLTGTGFLSDSVARSNGAALTTTYVSPTSMQAVIPATSFLTAQTLQISVFNPAQNQTSASIPFTVTAPNVAATVSAPPTAAPGDQPSITLTLAQAYPVPVSAKFSLAFTPISGGVVDPSIQFSTGGQSQSVDIAAGQTAVPAVQIQSGTVAGVIRITLTLTAGGIDVTPANTPVTTITIPSVVPALTQVTAARASRQITVSTFGYSNTREITQAHFHFTPAAGKQIQTQDITLDVTSIFSGWFGSVDSDTYGSAFLYTQTFTLDDDASVIGQVTVTLNNSIGTSAAGNSQ